MDLAKKSINKESLRWLFKRARTARIWVILAVGLGLGSGILLIAQARLLANIVHGAFMDNLPRNVLWPYFVTLFGVVMVRAVLGWGREVAGFHAGAKVREEVRMSLMEHIFTSKRTPATQLSGNTKARMATGIITANASWGR